MPTNIDIGLKKLSSNTLIVSNTIKAIGNLANQASYSLARNKGFYEELINSKIISPCFIGKNVVIKNSTIGPGTSIGEGTEVDNCSLKNCLIQNNSYLKDLTLNKAMIGNYVHYEGNHKFVSIGDYSKLKK